MAKNIAIAGAGVAGLSAAISCSLRGLNVSVFERSDRISEFGAGLQISPNGMKVLRALGVENQVLKRGFQPECIEMRLGPTGRQVFSIPIKSIAQDRWGAPYMNIHRGDLVAILKERLDTVAPNAIQTGMGVSSYSVTTDGARLDFENGQSHHADAVIGADGIRSRIREKMFGVDAPRFTGNVAWRAVVPIARLGENVPPPNACIWAGPGRHVVTTRICAGSMVNFVGVFEQRDWGQEGWKIPANKADVVQAFEGWDPVIPAIIENADEIFQWALHDRLPLKSWSEGPVGLIGDAAHPMLPSMAQGANQSLEDACAIGSLLGQLPPAQAFQALFEKRSKRTARIQRGSLRNARMFHRRSRFTHLSIYGPIWVLANFAPGLFHGRQDWVFGYDPVHIFK